MEGNPQVINGRICRERKKPTGPTPESRAGETVVERERDKSRVVSPRRRRGEEREARERNKGGRCEPPSLYPSPTSSPTNFFSSPHPLTSSPAVSRPLRNAAALHPPPPPARPARYVTFLAAIYAFCVPLGRRRRIDDRFLLGRPAGLRASSAAPEFRPARHRRRCFRRS